jgi:hypothetical protein
MKLKDLEVGQKFMFLNGNGKTYKKLSNNGDVLLYNTCICISDLSHEEKSGLMIIEPWKNRKYDKYADVIKE